MNTATPLGYVLRGYANHHVLYPLATTVANGVVFTACEAISVRNRSWAIRRALLCSLSSASTAGATTSLRPVALLSVERHEARCPKFWCAG